MSTRREVTYGPGGYDPEKPNNNVVQDVDVEARDTPPSDAERLAAVEDAVDTLILDALGG